MASSQPTYRRVSDNGDLDWGKKTVYMPGIDIGTSMDYQTLMVHYEEEKTKFAQENARKYPTFAVMCAALYETFEELYSEIQRYDFDLEKEAKSKGTEYLRKCPANISNDTTGVFGVFREEFVESLLLSISNDIPADVLPGTCFIIIPSRGILVRSSPMY